MVKERITILRRSDGHWLVKHGEGFLGAAKAQDEAVSIGRHLVDWLVSQGRPAELNVECVVSSSA